MLLSESIIDAEGIKNQPLTNWHFLFDPTGINVDASTFGLSEEISGFVVSSFTMGESSFREGIQVEREIQKPHLFQIKNMLSGSIQSADSAEISLIGLPQIFQKHHMVAEAFGVSPNPQKDLQLLQLENFPVMIIYGMAGMAGYWRHSDIVC